MNTMYVDPYIRMSHSKHWLSNSSKKTTVNKHKDAAEPPLPSKRKSKHLEEQVKKFNPQVIDTFCFHWPDMHSYVLVRVLDTTIAILPVRSRLAFLYFHHAPLPTHPSPQELRKALQPAAASKRIADMFKSWKHTLAIEEETTHSASDSDTEKAATATPEDAKSNSEDDVETSNSSVSSPLITETPPSTPKVHSNVTLSDVVSYERDLNNGWIHAPCSVTDDKNIFDNNVILTTQHTVLRLTARCFTEKMMFMNLVKMKQLDGENLQDAAQQAEELTSDEEEGLQSHRQSFATTIDLVSNDLTDSLQRETAHQLDQIQMQVSKIKSCREDIDHYTKQLMELEQSMDTLMDTTLNIQFVSLKRVLDYVNHQLADSITVYNKDRTRMAQLQERVSVHTAFLKGASQRFEQIKKRVRNHAWFPWIYTVLVGLVVCVPVALAYYYYHTFYT